MKRHATIILTHLIALVGGVTWDIGKRPPASSGGPLPSVSQPTYPNQSPSTSCKTKWDSLAFHFPRDSEKMGQLLVEWSRIDPVGALNAVDHLYDPDHAADFLRQMVAESGTDWPDIYFERLPRCRHLDDDCAYSMLKEIVSSLAPVDPDHALACVLSSSPGAHRSWLFEELLEHVQAKDFERISTLFGNHLTTFRSKEERRGGWLDLSTTIAKRQGMKGLLKWLQQISDPTALECFGRPLSGFVTSSETWSQIHEIAAALPPHLQDGVYQGIASWWKGDVALLDAAMSEPMLAAHLQKTEDSSPYTKDSMRSAALREWAMLQGPDEKGLVELALRHAWSKDSERMSASLTGESAGTNTDASAFSGVQHYLRIGESDEAKRCAGLISDPSLREHAEDLISDPGQH